MTIQSQYVLSKDSNGDVRLVQNSVDVFKSTNASAIANTLVLKEGMVGVGLVAPTTKLHVQVANTINKQALLIEQLDTTNNPICAEINNDGTNHGFYIHQDRVLAASKHGLYVYSNAAQTASQLIYFHQDNASSIYELLCIINDGSGGSIFANQTGVLDANQAALFIQSNAIQVTSPLIYFWQINASSTTPVLELDNNGGGHCLYAHQDGNLATGKYALYIDNNGTPADGAGKALRYDGCSVANGTGTVTISDLAPTGGSATISKWKLENHDGTWYRIPMWAV